MRENNVGSPFGEHERKNYTHTHAGQTRLSLGTKTGAHVSTSAPSCRWAVAATKNIRSSLIDVYITFARATSSVVATNPEHETKHGAGESKQHTITLWPPRNTLLQIVVAAAHPKREDAEQILVFHPRET